MPRRRHPAAAGRILATGVAVGAFGGAIGLMAGPAPAAVRTVTIPGPTRVIWVEVRHHPAPTAVAPPVASPGASSNSSSGAAITGLSPRPPTGAVGAATPAPAPSVTPAPASAPPPVATTRAS